MTVDQQRIEFEIKTLLDFYVGESLYVGESKEEVARIVAAHLRLWAPDPDLVSIWCDESNNTPATIDEGYLVTTVSFPDTPEYRALKEICTVANRKRS